MRAFAIGIREMEGCDFLAVPAENDFRALEYGLAAPGPACPASPAKAETPQADIGHDAIAGNFLDLGDRFGDRESSSCLDKRLREGVSRLARQCAGDGQRNRVDGLTICKGRTAPGQRA